MKFCKKCQCETERNSQGKCKPCYVVWDANRHAKQRLKDHPPRFCKNCNEITERCSLDRCRKCARVKAKAKADEKRRKRIEEFGNTTGRHEPGVYVELRALNKILAIEGKMKCVKCLTIKNFSEFHKSRLAKKDKESATCKQCDVKKYDRPTQVQERRSAAEKYIAEQKRPCIKCGVIKEFSFFTPSKTTLSGITSICKECAAKKAFDKRNTPEFLQKKADTATYLASDEHKQKKKDIVNNYHKERKQRDPLYKLTITLRGRLCTAIKKNYKSGSAVRDLGCSIAELKIYLEAKFTKKMTWENHGKVWHVDHIIPLSTFDLSNREELLKAVHYTNLQPMIIRDNISKKNKIPKNHQCSLLI